MDATPPTRAPHYFDNETHGWSLFDCACNLIGTLTWFAYRTTAFTGAATGSAWRVEGEPRDRGRILFSTNRGDGRIEFSVDASFWVRAELFIGDDLKFRGWFEETYEEKEFWPDGSDGVDPPSGDAPGRISKRGAWLQIRTAEFPGVIGDEHGYFDLEIVDP